MFPFYFDRLDLLRSAEIQLHIDPGCWIGSGCPIRLGISVHNILSVMLRIRRGCINISTSANIGASSAFPSEAHTIVPNMWHFQLPTWRQCENRPPIA
jgi:hypothetical protein